MKGKNDVTHFSNLVNHFYFIHDFFKKCQKKNFRDGIILRLSKDDLRPRP
jgi:hypothetical protein